MQGLLGRLKTTVWTRDLVLLACAMFLNRFGQGLLSSARTNFFIDTLGLTGNQVLWLEGIRELPGLGLMFIAALTMRWPLSRRAALSVLIMGVGYALYASVNSYTALLAVAIVASLGVHMWIPLSRSLGMCLSTKDTTGQVLGSLSSVGALASIVGMGVVSVVAKLLGSLSLRAYYVGGAILIVAAGYLILRISTSVGATRQRQPRMLLKRRYWLYYVLTFFQGSRKQVLNTFGMLVLVENFGLEVWQISTLMFVSSITNLAAGPYIGYLVDRFGERKTVSLSYVFLALCCIGFAAIHDVWILAVLLIAIKLAVMLGMGLSTYVHKIAPAEELTPTLSAGISINHVTSVTMPIIAGALLPLVGYEGVFLGTAGLILLSIPFALGLKVSEIPAPRAAPASAE